MGWKWSKRRGWGKRNGERKEGGVKLEGHHEAEKGNNGKRHRYEDWGGEGRMKVWGMNDRSRG